MLHHAVTQVIVITYIVMFLNWITGYIVAVYLMYNFAEMF